MDFLEKIAAKKITDIKAYEAKLSEDHKEDRELIKKVQLYQDKFAMKKLMLKYRGAIQGAVNSSGLMSIMDRGIAEQYAMSAFKDIISKKFKLDEDVQPNTAIINLMNFALTKEKNRYSDMSSRKSEDLQHVNRIFNTTNTFLRNELNRDPEDHEILNFVNENYGKSKTGKDRITMDHIRKLKSMNIRELSGNIQIGGKDDSNAEYLTLGDIKDVGKMTPQEIFNSSMNEYKVNRVIDKFDRQERTFIRQYLGIGEFKGKPAKSLNDAASANLLTNYRAKAVVEKLKGLLKK